MKGNFENHWTGPASSKASRTDGRAGKSGVAAETGTKTKGNTAGCSRAAQPTRRSLRPRPWAAPARL